MSPYSAPSCRCPERSIDCLPVISLGKIVAYRAGNVPESLTAMGSFTVKHTDFSGGNRLFKAMIADRRADS